MEAAVTYLKTRKEVDKSAIGLIGHSEGGMIAPMIASKNRDVKFIVLTGLSSQYEADGSTPEVISCQSELTALSDLFPESM